MINFIICDDNLMITKNVSEIIDKVMIKNDLQYEKHIFNNYNKDFLNIIKKPLLNKIYILDIETPAESGINMARKIRQNDIDSVIIFLTSHYELGSVLLEDEIMFLTFISKFNNQEARIISAINKALKMIGHKQAIRFEDRGTVYTIPLKDILYITRDSVDRKTIIKTDYTEFKVNKSFQEIFGMLNNSFVQTYRSCAANKDRISSVNRKNNTIVFDNGLTIDLLSDNYKKEVI